MSFERSVEKFLKEYCEKGRQVGKSVLTNRFPVKVGGGLSIELQCTTFRCSPTPEGEIGDSYATISEARDVFTKAFDAFATGHAEDAIYWRCQPRVEKAGRPGQEDKFIIYARLALGPVEQGESCE